MERKKSGRMTDIPQLGPEVFVDDADEIAKRNQSAYPPPATLLSPLDASDPRGSFIAHGLDGATRHRRGTDASHSDFVSPNTPGYVGGSGLSPQLSPRHVPHHRATHSAFSFEGGELTSPGGSGQNSPRRGSAAENVLEVLDNSAWGESIRRSFTMRRPPGEGSSGM